MKKIILRLCVSALVIAPGAASAASVPYAPAKVIEAMKRVDGRLKIIVSHRGSYGPMCPENSVCAVGAAVANGIEAVEIDVKESRDGTPWPSHDLTIGRGTTYTRNGIFFNPYNRTPANDANNPLLSSMSDAELRNLALRDVDGRVVSAYKNISLKEFLSYAAFYHKNIVFIFDIKFPQSVKKVAQIAKDLRIEDRVVLKFSSTFFNPLQVFQQTQGLAFAPTLYAPQLDEIADKYYLEKAPNDRVLTYMKAFSFIKGFTYYEIGNKTFRPFGSSVGIVGPLEPITRQLQRDKHPIGNFIPVIEHFADSRSREVGFYHTDGYCCTQLNNFLSRSQRFGNEQSDNRTDLKLQVRFNENVITDDAVAALAEAERLGSRQDVWRIK